MKQISFHTILLSIITLFVYRGSFGVFQEL